MKKLRSLALYALVAPAITLGAGSVLAEQTGQKTERQQQSSQYEQGAGQSGSQQMQDGQAMGEQSRMQRQGYMASAPAQGMHASDLIGLDIKTTDDENVGAVSDLIIDRDGQVVAVVVGVGGFLGMGEKDVAIGWDHVTASGTADDRELRVNLTRDELRSAPKFESQD